MEYHWPGNVRELKNLIERAMILEDGPIIDTSALPIEPIQQLPASSDASLPDLNPHHYVSVEEYHQNLTKLVDKAQSLLNHPPILLVTPPPVHHGQRLEYQKTRYGDKATGVLERTLENSGVYAEACVQAAAEKSVPCLNLWKSFQAEADWSRFLSDGLHFSPAGHDFVFSQLQSTIQREFPDLHVEPCPITGQSCNSASHCSSPHLRTFGPYHDQINANHPDAAMKAAFPANSAAAAGSSSSKSNKRDSYSQAEAEGGLATTKDGAESESESGPSPAKKATIDAP